eukprot:6879757-Lingulodinium_polyedra.AAC.1
MRCGTPGCRWQHACVGCGRLWHGPTCCPDRLTPAELRQLEAHDAQAAATRSVPFGGPLFSFG